MCFATLVPASAITFSIMKLRGSLVKIIWIAAFSGGAALVALVIGELAGKGSWSESPSLTLALICSAYATLGSKSIANYFDTWKIPLLRTAYSCACFALLMVVAGIPGIAFFKLSYDYDESLAIRRQQLLTLAALNQRERSVVDQYFQVRVSGERGSFSDDLGKWLFLRRRLQEQNLDLYDKAFRAQSAGQIIREHDDQPWPYWWISLASWVPHRSESLTAVVADDCSEGSQWRWNEVGINRIHIRPNHAAWQTAPDYEPCSSDARTARIRNQLAIGTEPAEASPETLALQKLAIQDPIFLAQHLTYQADVLRPWGFLHLAGVVSNK